MDDIQIHIAEKPYMPEDKGPQVIIGFTSAQFSQAVYVDAPSDPKDCVKVADSLYKGFIEACAVAVKNWESFNAEIAGMEAEEGSVEEGSDGEA